MNEILKNLDKLRENCSKAPRHPWWKNDPEIVASALRENVNIFCAQHGIILEEWSKQREEE